MAQGGRIPTASGDGALLSRGHSGFHGIQTENPRHRAVGRPSGRAARADGRPPSEDRSDDKHLFDLLKRHTSTPGIRCHIASPRTSWRSCKRESSSCRACPCGVSGKDRDVLRSGRDAQKGFARSSDAERAGASESPTSSHRSTGVWEVGAELVRTRGTEGGAAVARGQRAERKTRPFRAEGIQIGKLESALGRPSLARFRHPKEVEQRIAECTDPVLLVSWLSRAATVSDVSDLLAG